MCVCLCVSVCAYVQGREKFSVCVRERGVTTLLNALLILFCCDLLQIGVGQSFVLRTERDTAIQARQRFWKVLQYQYAIHYQKEEERWGEICPSMCGVPFLIRCVCHLMVCFCVGGDHDGR